VAVSPSPAVAAPDTCAASQIAKTVGVVATNTGTYLDTHPQTNQALTTISQQQAGPQTLVALKGYFDANPQAGKDLQAIQQPLTSLSTQCTMPVSLPQLLGLLQGAQSAAGAAPAQAVGGQSPTAAATTSAVAVPAGSGPLPGPAPYTAR
jgi:hemophore